MKLLSLWILFFMGMSSAISQTVSDSGQFSLVINGLSKHFDIDPGSEKKNFNEKNWGIGFQYDFPRFEKPYGWYLNAGEYKDSLNATAIYSGGGGMYDLYRNDGWHAQVGVQGSLFYSSQYNKGHPFLALLPVASVGSEKIAANIAFVPKVTKMMDAGAVFMQLKVALPK